MVVCTGFRNPALTAKLSSTIDVISGGRFELGIGAGWKEDEWRAYGYGFPPLAERMAAFGDHLEVITAMFAPGRATYEGRHATVRGAYNVPKGLQQPRLPIIVGGNGEQVTAGYAIRYADELNYVFLEPDVIAGGRAELGIGAGWKEDEWRAYGYGFPDAPERLAILADHLEVISRMLGPGHATWAGRHASVDDAIHEPKSAGERIPILIGGNGPKVTWRLAARFGDELNLDALLPDEVEQAMPVIAARCTEIGRDPSTLRVSVHVWGRPDAPAGAPRRERLRAFRDVGVTRVMLQGFGAVSDPGLLERVADDCAAVGLLGADAGA